MKHVYLVGAGPGDPKLLTLKGLEAIQQADVIIYDRLASPALLKHAKAGCQLIYAGKASSDHILPQDEINGLLIEKALEGKAVVRLKGGDPYVFGRGGEEALALLEAGISFEAVPGITSAIGGLAYAGIPITHRGLAASFHVFTGHLQKDFNLDWPVIASLEGTLVFLMGVKNLPQIVAGLIGHGKDPATPAALISWASTPLQRVHGTTLGSLAQTAAKEGVQPPTLIVIGQVAALREQLSFFEHKPFFGLNIGVTRATRQNSTLVEKIADLGGNPLELPAIKIKKIPDNTILEEAIKALNHYQYLVFTSINGVEIFFEKLLELSLDSRALAGVAVAAIGSQTAAALAQRGIRADFVPKSQTLEGLAEILLPVVKPQDRLLLPKALVSRDVLQKALPDQVTEVAVYETQADLQGRDQLCQALDQGALDYATFTSASTAIHFTDLVGPDYRQRLSDTKLISIGPVTSRQLKSLGLNVYREAKEASMDALIQIIKEDLSC